MWLATAVQVHARKSLRGVDCGACRHRIRTQATGLKRIGRGSGGLQRRLEKGRAAKVVIGPVSVGRSGGTAAVDFGDGGDSDQKRIRNHAQLKSIVEVR